MAFDLLRNAEQALGGLFDHVEEEVDLALRPPLPDKLLKAFSEELDSEPAQESEFLSTAVRATAPEKMNYNFEYFPPLPFLDKVPLRENFQPRWLLMAGIRILQAVLNQIAVKEPAKVGKAKKAFSRLEKAYEEFNEKSIAAGIWRLFATLPLVIELVAEAGILAITLKNAFAQLGEDSEGGIHTLTTFNEQLIELLKSTAPSREFSKLQDYEDLFQVIPLPPVAQSFQDDQVFADMRVAGPNPMNLVKLTAPIADFPLSQADYQRIMGADDSLDQAIASGRAFAVDYTLLTGAVLGTFPDYQKVLYPVVGLFVVPKSGAQRRAKAVGIRIQAGGPVHTPPPPGDAAALQRWKTAKNCFQIADANIHEAISHLGQTHLVIEPIAIAASRNLPASHPMMKLLSPHFVGTFAINNAAQAFLIASKGPVDSLLASTIDQDRVVAVLGTQAVTKHFNQHFVPKALQARGVSGPGVDLPYFPYRDAALELWGIIRNWCKSYVDIHYLNDAAVVNDSALQKMLVEMLSFQGGRMADVGEDGAFKTRAYLSDFATMVIFTASAQHAAVNFPQYWVMSYAPAMPLAGYAQSEQAFDNWEDALPPMDQALTQLNILWLLGTIYYNQLGQYPRNQFSGAPTAAALKQFQDELKAFEAAYPSRFPDYAYLLPSKIPASINI